MRRILLGFVVGTLAASSFAHAAPGNDFFSAAKLVGSLPFEETLDIEGTTLESGEPRPDCAEAAGSVWYRMTSGRIVLPVVVSTFGSDFDSFVAVYRGSSLDDLTQDACSDNLWARYQGQASFVVQPGEVIFVQAGPTVAYGAYGRPGYSLRIRFAPGAMTYAGTATLGAAVGVMAGPDATTAIVETRTIHTAGLRVEGETNTAGADASVTACPTVYHITWCEEPIGLP